MRVSGHCCRQNPSPCPSLEHPRTPIADCSLSAAHTCCRPRCSLPPWPRSSSPHACPPPHYIGPANPDGLQLRSKRIVGGLEARIRIPAKYCAFPGIINGGILSTIVDCHGAPTPPPAAPGEGGGGDGGGMAEGRHGRPPPPLPSATGRLVLPPACVACSWHGGRAAPRQLHSQAPPVDL